MNCEEANHCLEAFLDRELGAKEHLEVEEHLNSCPACRSAARQSQEFRSFFAAAAPRYKAPAELRGRILAALEPLPPKQTFLSFVSAHRPMVYAAAAICLSLILALTFILPDKGKELCSLAVTAHARSLTDNHLVDVSSDDRRVIKPWFAAKLDFAPPLINLPAPGYSLIGARVDALRNDPVAVCVYEHRQEIVTLFCWPASRRPVLDRAYVIQGYHVCTWSSSKCNYILVSKSSGPSLNEFVDSFRDRVDMFGNQLPSTTY
ncbi:MAG TPA: zf-HC2 domain-containing protein [Chthoniobacterales bacterium]|jgi:anti-sigma factor RsiW|nr:zf-HC2 domain-containing protein [Chthoniobacterales bacterium]